MGGMSVLALLAMVGTPAVVVLVVVCLATAAFLAATVVSVVFAARTKKRRAQGKKLKGLIAIPIVLYALSIPVLIWFSVAFVVPLAHEATISDYDDCSAAIVTHAADDLEAQLAAAGPSIPLEGAQSWESLLRISIEYGDADCAAAVIDSAGEQGVALDLDAPLADYDTDGKPFDEAPALLLAIDDNYSSPEMVEVLLEHGAGPNITLSSAAGSTSDAETSDGSATALHVACAGVGGHSLYIDTEQGDDLRLLAETDEVVDLLIEYGASLTARNGERLTPWEVYRDLVGDMQENGSLTATQAREIIADRASALKP